LFGMGVWHQQPQAAGGERGFGAHAFTFQERGNSLGFQPQSRCQGRTGMMNAQNGHPVARLDRGFRIICPVFQRNLMLGAWGADLRPHEAFANVAIALRDQGVSALGAEVGIRDASALATLAIAGRKCGIP